MNEQKAVEKKEFTIYGQTVYVQKLSYRQVIDLFHFLRKLPEQESLVEAFTSGSTMEIMTHLFDSNLVEDFFQVVLTGDVKKIDFDSKDLHFETVLEVAVTFFELNRDISKQFSNLINEIVRIFPQGIDAENIPKDISN